MDKQNKSSMRVGVAFIVGIVLLLLIGNAVLSQWSPFRGNGGGYDSYRGPVLPMTALSGGESVEVERHVDFDFAPYETADPKSVDPSEVILTDTYRLTNTTNETVTVDLAYPFQGSLIDEARFFPAITANGAAVDAALYPSVDAKSLLSQAEDWEDYKAALTENDYFAEATSEVTSLDTPVIVYQISDAHYDGAEEVTNKYLALSYAVNPEKTTIWTYGTADNESDDGRHYVTLNVQENAWDWGHCYLLILGEDIFGLSQQGHHTTFPPKESNKLAGVSATVERFESTFGEMVYTLAQLYGSEPQYDERFENNPYATPEALYNGAMRRIGNKDYHTSATVYQSISEAFYAVLSEEVLMYYVFELELAPGETITVEAKYHQQASDDLSGTKAATDGYDMATRLGSSLNLDVQSASVSNSNLIEITEQNFGFDLPGGITEVSLDPETERYYMKVAAK